MNIENIMGEEYEVVREWQSPAQRDGTVYVARRVRDGVIVEIWDEAQQVIEHASVRDALRSVRGAAEIYTEECGEAARIAQEIINSIMDSEDA